MVTWIQRYSKGDERDLRAFERDRIQRKSDFAFEREVEREESNGPRDRKRFRRNPSEGYRLGLRPVRGEDTVKKTT